MFHKTESDFLKPGIFVRIDMADRHVNWHPYDRKSYIDRQDARVDAAESSKEMKISFTFDKQTNLR